MTTHLYNVGTESDLTIRDLALLIQGCVGHHGEILWDSSKPDGTPRKVMDSSKFRAIGWQPSIELLAGVQSTYEWYLLQLSRLS